MQVTAIKPGYLGRLREVGEVFDVPEGAHATWFAPLAAAAPPKDAKPKDAKPKQAQPHAEAPLA